MPPRHSLHWLTKGVRTLTRYFGERTRRPAAPYIQSASTDTSANSIAVVPCTIPANVAHRLENEYWQAIADRGDLPTKYQTSKQIPSTPARRPATGAF
jgi:hypothetical protein